MNKKIDFFTNLKSDFPAGLVVFLVALPLCLGIALASGAPPLSGIISGVIGGIVVGSLSQSPISVSGPAAGLTSIVLVAITSLGSFELFLLSVFLAGVLQLVLGFVKAGSVSKLFPSNVIEGMLAGIGIIIIITQLVHAVGFDNNYGGREQLFRLDGSNPFSDIPDIVRQFEPVAIIITIISLVILIAWDKIPTLKRLRIIPGALAAVVAGILINQLLKATGNPLALEKEHLVDLPVVNSVSGLQNIIILPDFSAFGNLKVWITACTIAMVASIETLLCIEASDRMDLLQRYTDTNVELKAQGIGNILSALLGGLPMTSVVVRSSANANAGAKTKMAAIIHGILLLICVLAIPVLLNKIPLATLAAVLILVGYKLASPLKVMYFWTQGKYQFIPFIITLIVVVAYGLLWGVGVGILLNFFFILYGKNKRVPKFPAEKYPGTGAMHIDLANEDSAFNITTIKAILDSIPGNTKAVIDASGTSYITTDVLNFIRNFKDGDAKKVNIEVVLIGFEDANKTENNSGSYIFRGYNGKNGDNKQP
ncbi:hypothetical protein CHU92_02090 [Flavobacterium cyanobacteriorum]|uniref:SLC26A/SulP transporter domain-containing protein n=1 Tax=Flavobacterium cyanobacteriorum TaxID=2022802 RepID=A0A255ZV36_9FLAO|nr:SulP family inorganic anion transporter [Flavobacterium cyanobacteriorum]OYQ45296.1 hypothetical protein CHU92_02090 [Flavobacterium cyanobacteriorum]